MDINLEIRGVLLNDYTDIEYLIKTNIEDSHYWSVDIESDIKIIISQNISNKTLNKSFCIVSQSIIIGLIYFYNYDLIKNSIFMGYLLDKKFRGKGIMSYSIKYLIDIYMKLNVESIYTITDTRNLRSEKTLKRIGFTENKIINHKNITYIMWLYLFNNNSNFKF